MAVHILSHIVSTATATATATSTSTLYPTIVNQVTHESPYHDRVSTNIHDAIYGFSAVSLTFTTLSTCMRIYTKFNYFKVRRWDDYLMIAAWACLVVMWAFLLRSVHYGAGDHFDDVSSSEIPSFQGYAFLHELFYAIVQCLLKTSIALQIMHIFVPNPRIWGNRNPKFWIIFVFIVLQDLWFMVFFWISLFQCSPIRRGFYPTMKGYCLGGWDDYNIVVSVGNMVADICMLAFPLYCVSKLKMRSSYKFEAGGVFIVGALAIASSLLRLIFSIRRLHTGDLTLVLTQIALCDTGEITAGIIVGNFVPFPRFLFEMSENFRSMTGRQTRRQREVLSTCTNTTNSRILRIATTDGVRSTSARNMSRLSALLSYEELVGRSSAQRHST